MPKTPRGSHHCRRDHGTASAIEAVFENGVFRPLRPIDLLEHVRIRFTVEPVAMPG